MFEPIWTWFELMGQNMGYVVHAFKVEKFGVRGGKRWKLKKLDFLP